MGLSLGLGLYLGASNLGQGGLPASAYAARAAPTGYAWDFVTYRGANVTYRAVPVVALIKVA